MGKVGLHRVDEVGSPQHQALGPDIQQGQTRRDGRRVNNRTMEVGLKQSCQEGRMSQIEAPADRGFLLNITVRVMAEDVWTPRLNAGEKGAGGSRDAA